MSGVLFLNDRKESPNHPDMKGTAEINGVQMWVSCWVKTGKPGSKMAGKTFWSLSFKPKDSPGQTQTTQQQPQASQQSQYARTEPKPAPDKPEPRPIPSTYLPIGNSADEDVPF